MQIKSVLLVMLMVLPVKGCTVADKREEPPKRPPSNILLTCTNDKVSGELNYIRNQHPGSYVNGETLYQYGLCLSA